MKYLLDTCTFLWVVLDAPELSENARSARMAADNEFYLSVVSVWEIGLKYGAGKLKLPRDPAQYIPYARKLHGMRELPLDEVAVLTVSRLPKLHKDPFDRMLVCQAITHGLTILTPDPQLRQYPAQTHW